MADNSEDQKQSSSDNSEEAKDQQQNSNDSAEEAKRQPSSENLSEEAKIEEPRQEEKQPEPITPITIVETPDPNSPNSPIIPVVEVQGQEAPNDIPNQNAGEGDVAVEDPKSAKSKAFERKIYAAEGIATFFFVFLALKINVEIDLRDIEAGNHALTDYLRPIATGMAMTCGFMIAGGLSGAHLNTLVTFGFFLGGKVRVVDFIIYAILHILAGALASLFVFGMYHDRLSNRYGPDMINYLELSTDMKLTMDHVLLSGLLGGFVIMLTVAAITDPTNMRVPPQMMAIYVPMVITMTVMVFQVGSKAGFMANPLIDIVMRVVLLALFSVPFDAVVFLGYLAMLIGAAFGSVLYFKILEGARPEDNLPAEPVGHREFGLLPLYGGVGTSK